MRRRNERRRDTSKVHHFPLILTTLLLFLSFCSSKAIFGHHTESNSILRPTRSESPTLSASTSTTLTPSTTPTISNTSSPSISPTLSPSFTPSSTPSISPSSSISLTPSRTHSIAPSTTPTRSPSITPSSIPSISPSSSISLTPSPTPSSIPSTTPSPSQTNKHKDLLIIDDFAGYNNISFTLETIPQSNTSFYDSPLGHNDLTLLGGERDMLLTAISGSFASSFSSFVFIDDYLGQWTSSTPLYGNSYSSLQYDGIDHSMALNVTGLMSVNRNGVDLTVSGFARFFHIDFLSNNPFTLSFGVYDILSNECFYSTSLYGSGSLFIPFSQLLGYCELTRVGAVTLSVELEQITETFITFFSTST